MMERYEPPNPFKDMNDKEYEIGGRLKSYIDPARTSWFSPFHFPAFRPLAPQFRIIRRIASSFPRTGPSPAALPAYGGQIVV